MQCHMYLRSDIWSQSGVRCEREATYEVRHNGLVVSNRCDEHAGRLNEEGERVSHDSQYIITPLPIPA